MNRPVRTLLVLSVAIVSGCDAKPQTSSNQPVNHTSQTQTSTSEAEIVEDDHPRRTTFGAWSEPTNFLSARFIVTLEEYEAADSPSYFGYSVVLEVRNDHGADLTFVNQPTFGNVEVRDDVLLGSFRHKKSPCAGLVCRTQHACRIDLTPSSRSAQHSESQRRHKQARRLDEPATQGRFQATEAGATCVILALGQSIGTRKRLNTHLWT